MRLRKSKSSKAQAIPQHRLDASRQQWTRKPQTQIVINKKAEQRRTMCRKKGIPDGAVFISYRPVIGPAFKIRRRICCEALHRAGKRSLRECRSCRAR